MGQDTPEAPRLAWRPQPRERGQGERFANLTQLFFNPRCPLPRQVHIEFEGSSILSWVGLTGETGVSPRPSETIGHWPWKFWMNATGVPVSESGDDCPQEILVTSSSGRPRPTGWREWLGSRTPKGDASCRVIPSSSAVSANRYPSVRIESGHASKFGNCSRTPFPFPDPVSSPSVSTKRWRSASSMKIRSRRSPRFMT